MPFVLRFGAEMRGGATFVQRLALMRRCVGESRASRTPVDLSGALCDARALQELVTELLLPLVQLQIDQVVALHVQNCEAIRTSSKHQHGAPVVVESVRKSSRTKRVREEAEKVKSAGGSNGGEPMAEREAQDGEVHHFTTAIAGAMAGARQLGGHSLVQCVCVFVWVVC